MSAARNILDLIRRYVPPMLGLAILALAGTLAIIWWVHP